MQKTNKLPKYIKLNDKIRPQDDFYTYVCHHWLKDNPRPANRGRWSHFHLLDEKVSQEIKQIVQTWRQSDLKKLTAEQQLVVAHYENLMNKDKLAQKTLKSLQVMIAEIQTSSADQAELLAKAASYHVETFFALDIELDAKNNQRFIMEIVPAGLELPNRDYYINLTRPMKMSRQAYLEFGEKYTEVLTKAGLKNDFKASAILKIETVLAKFIWPIHKTNDHRKIYNIYKWSEFCQKFSFDWATYFAQRNIESPAEIFVQQPSCLTDALHYLKSLSEAELKEYLMNKIIADFGSLINEEITQVNFDFFGKTLSGIKELKPLDERAVNEVNGIFTDILGQAYVAKHFPPDRKKAADNLATQVAAAFKKRLAKNQWMSQKSLAYAQQKLDKIVVNIGYTNLWQKYDGLKLSPDDLLNNILAIIKFKEKQKLALLKTKPDRHHLGYSPNSTQGAQLATAWTHISLLNTNYPAAFLQIPFYDHQAGFAYNVGTLGSVIGHELTHNFDERGAQYDKDGHLNPWLGKEEQKQFKRSVQKIIKRAAKHKVAPGVHMKGKQVVNELIADLGGLEIALDIVKEHYKDEKTQQKEALRTVFIAYGFRLASNESKEVRVMLAKSGVHPDPAFRANGIVVHCEDFYKIFEVKPGDNLYLAPSERALIW